MNREEYIIWEKSIKNTFKDVGYNQPEVKQPEQPKNVEVEPKAGLKERIHGIVDNTRGALGQAVSKGVNTIKNVASKAKANLEARHANDAKPTNNSSLAQAFQKGVANIKKKGGNNKKEEQLKLDFKGAKKAHDAQVKAEKQAVKDANLDSNGQASLNFNKAMTPKERVQYNLANAKGKVSREASDLAQKLKAGYKNLKTNTANTVDNAKEKVSQLAQKVKDTFDKSPKQMKLDFNAKPKETQAEQLKLDVHKGTTGTQGVFTKDGKTYTTATAEKVANNLKDSGKTKTKNALVPVNTNKQLPATIYSKSGAGTFTKDGKTYTTAVGQKVADNLKDSGKTKTKNDFTNVDNNEFKTKTSGDSKDIDKSKDTTKQTNTTVDDSVKQAETPKKSFAQKVKDGLNNAYDGVIRTGVKARNLKQDIVQDYKARKERIENEESLKRVQKMIKDHADNRAILDEINKIKARYSNGNNPSNYNNTNATASDYLNQAREEVNNRNNATNGNVNTAGTQPNVNQPNVAPANVNNGNANTGNVNTNNINQPNVAPANVNNGNVNQPNVAPTNVNNGTQPIVTPAQQVGANLQQNANNINNSNNQPNVAPNNVNVNNNVNNGAQPPVTPVNVNNQPPVATANVNNNQPNGTPLTPVQQVNANLQQGVNNVNNGAQPPVTPVNVNTGAQPTVTPDATNVDNNNGTQPTEVPSTEVPPTEVPPTEAPLTPAQQVKNNLTNANSTSYKGITSTDGMINNAKFPYKKDLVEKKAGLVRNQSLRPNNKGRIVITANGKAIDVTDNAPRIANLLGSALYYKEMGNLNGNTLKAIKSELASATNLPNEAIAVMIKNVINKNGKIGEEIKYKETPVNSNGVQELEPGEAIKDNFSEFLRSKYKGAKGTAPYSQVDVNKFLQKLDSSDFDVNNLTDEEKVIYDDLKAANYLSTDKDGKVSSLISSIEPNGTIVYKNNQTPNVAFVNGKRVEGVQGAENVENTTPTEETPTEETPTEETPTEETPDIENTTPTEETPTEVAPDETETPAPAEETPAPAETEVPNETETPDEETTTPTEAPVEETPTEETPAEVNRIPREPLVEPTLDATNPEATEDNINDYAANLEAEAEYNYDVEKERIIKEYRNAIKNAKTATEKQTAGGKYHTAMQELENNRKATKRANQEKIDALRNEYEQIKVAHAQKVEQEKSANEITANLAGDDISLDELNGGKKKKPGESNEPVDLGNPEAIRQHNLEILKKDYDPEKRLNQLKQQALSTHREDWTNKVNEAIIKNDTKELTKMVGEEGVAKLKNYMAFRNYIVNAMGEAGILSQTKKGGWSTPSVEQFDDFIEQMPKTKDMVDAPNKFYDNLKTKGLGGLWKDSILNGTIDKKELKVPTKLPENDFKSYLKENGFIENKVEGENNTASQIPSQYPGGVRKREFQTAFKNLALKGEYKDIKADELSDEVKDALKRYADYSANKDSMSDAEKQAMSDEMDLLMYKMASNNATEFGFEYKSRPKKYNKKGADPAKRVRINLSNKK